MLLMQVHTANSFSMQLPPAHLGAVLPVHGGLVSVGQASMVTASMDNIPVPAAMVNSTMGVHSSAANRNTDRYEHTCDCGCRMRRCTCTGF